MKYRMRSSFFQKVISIISKNFFLYIVGMITTILTARFLGTEGKGIQGLITATAGIIVQFANLGIQSANTYYIAKDKNNVSFALGNCIFIVSGTMIVLFISGFFFQNFVLLEKPYIMLVFMLVFVQLILSFISNIFIALGDVKTFNYIDIIISIVNLALLITTVLANKITPFIVTLSVILASCVGLIYAIRKLFNKIKKIRFNKQYFFKSIKFGIKAYIACLFQYLVLRVDVIMLGKMSGNSEVGIYTVAVTLIDIINMITVSVGALQFPEIVSMNNIEKEYKFTRKLQKYMAVIISVIGVLSSFLIKYVISIFYGKEYIRSSTVFIILIFGVLFLSQSSIIINYLTAKQNFRSIILIEIIAFLVNIVLNLLLIPRINAYGAALASAVTYFVLFLLAHLVFKGYSRKRGKEKNNEKKYSNYNN